MFRYTISLVILLTAYSISIIAQNLQKNDKTVSANKSTSITRTSVAGRGIFGNLLNNGDFSDGDTYWETWINPAANASGSVENEEFVMSITNGGTEVYHVQLIQKNLT